LDIGVTVGLIDGRARLKGQAFEMAYRFFISGNFSIRSLRITEKQALLLISSQVHALA